MRYVVILLLFAGMGLVPVTDLALTSILDGTYEQGAKIARQGLGALRWEKPVFNAVKSLAPSERTGVVPDFDLALGPEFDPDGRC